MYSDTENELLVVISELIAQHRVSASDCYHNYIYLYKHQQSRVPMTSLNNYIVGSCTREPSYSRTVAISHVGFEVHV